MREICIKSLKLFFLFQFDLLLDLLARRRKLRCYWIFLRYLNSKPVILDSFLCWSLYNRILLHLSSLSINFIQSFHNFLSMIDFIPLIVINKTSGSRITLFLLFRVKYLFIFIHVFIL